MKQLTIIGNIGYDAVIKETNGNKFVTFTVAVNESYKDASGQKVEKTNWISCLSRQLALAQYLTKGKKILAQGKMDVSVYKGKDQQYRAGINLTTSHIEFVGGPKKEEGSAEEAKPENITSELTAAGAPDLSIIPMGEEPPF